MTKRCSIRRALPWLVLATQLVSGVALSTGVFSGTITSVEVWRNGNVAFRLSDPTSTSACNGQFILDVSDAGTKSQYAALLAAKKTSTPIVITSSTCAPADGYGGSYNTVDYLYLNQD